MPAAPRRLLALVGAVTLGRLAVISRFELAGDEALYWLWSRTLDLGYLTHPPFVAYTIRIFGRLADVVGFSGEAGVRLGAVLYAAGTTVAVYALAARVFRDARAGLYAALALQCAVGFGAMAILMTPDAPLLFFWSVALVALVRAVSPEEDNRSHALAAWLAAGGCLGLALLSKYSAVLLIPAVLIVVGRGPWRPPWRWLVASLLLCLALFSPVVVWDARHGWASFHVQVLDRLARAETTSGGVRSLVEFLLAQVGLLTPPLFLGGTAALVWLWRTGRSDAARRLLWWSAVVPFGVFSLYSLRGHAEANWAAPAYIGVAGAFGGWLASRPTLGHWWPVSLASSAVFVVLVHVHLLTPVIRLPAGMDLTNRVAGWRVVGREVDRLQASMPAGQVFVLGADYQMAAEAAFYAATRVPTFTLQSLQAFGAVTHLPGDFWTTAESARGSHAVCVAEGTPRWEQVTPWFETVEPEPPVTVRRGGQVIRTYFLARCLNFRGRA